MKTFSSSLQLHLTISGHLHVKVCRTFIQPDQRDTRDHSWNDAILLHTFQTLRRRSIAAEGLCWEVKWTRFSPAVTTHAPDQVVIMT